jgi:hypothetical protein
MTAAISAIRGFFHTDEDPAPPIKTLTPKERREIVANKYSNRLQHVNADFNRANSTLTDLIKDVQCGKKPCG